MVPFASGMNQDTRARLRTLSNDDLETLANRNAPNALRNQVLFNVLPKSEHPGLRYAKDFAEFELERRQSETVEARQAAENINAHSIGPLSDLSPVQTGALVLGSFVALVAILGGGGGGDPSDDGLDEPQGVELTFDDDEEAEEAEPRR